MNYTIAFIYRLFVISVASFILIKSIMFLAEKETEENKKEVKYYFVPNIIAGSISIIVLLGSISHLIFIIKKL